MKKHLIKYFLFVVCFGVFANIAEAQTEEAYRYKTQQTTKNN